MASERGLPPLQILAAGRAIASGQAIIPIDLYPINPGRAVLDLVNIKGDVAALEHGGNARDVGGNAAVLQTHDLEGGLAALEPRIRRAASPEPRNVGGRAVAHEPQNVEVGAVAPEHRNARFLK